MKRQTLKALAKSRGYTVAVMHERVPDADWWMAEAKAPSVGGVECCAPTRRAATEGLRAALQALPEVEKERKR